MAVNGGGGVTLQFQRSPLKATTRTLYLAWNKIVVISPVIMTPHGTSGRVHLRLKFLGWALKSNGCLILAKIICRAVQLIFNIKKWNLNLIDL